jgi:hypothetical protein
MEEMEFLLRVLRFSSDNHHRTNTPFPPMTAPEVRDFIIISNSSSGFTLDPVLGAKTLFYIPQ